MNNKALAWAEARRLQAVFTQAGALPVETDILQPAATLLDLYGEDIRGRAYVTQDALRGEQMLRPDFTVPVVQMHMADGAEPARYTYAGEVFRKQEEDPDRPSEYLQVGYEVFDRNDSAAADAEVFDLFLRETASFGVRAVTGDIGLLRAAVEGLHTTEPRKAALMRHLWRPVRFRALMARFSAPSERRDFPASDAPWIGTRSEAEMTARMDALQDDTNADPISKEECDLLQALLCVKAPLPEALAILTDLSTELASIKRTVAIFEARLEALRQRGIPVDDLAFEASYGRTAMEYYDGFVFGLYAKARADLPALATGGRYDALTRVLGEGASIPAVGGVMRPALMADLREGSR